MALNERTPNNIVYLNVANGYIVRRFRSKLECPTAIERTQENGNVVYEQHLESVDGIITDIKIVPTEFKGIKVEKGQIRVTIADGEETYVVSMHYSSSYAKRFINALANVSDVSKPIRIFPWKMENREKPGKYFQGVTLYTRPGDRSSKVEVKYQRDDVPAMVEVKVKGQTIWDDTAQMEFFEGVLNTEILPRIATAKTDAALAKMSVPMEQYDGPDSAAGLNDAEPIGAEFDDVPF
jgi:hypothetical protein